jgi:hypothetical protein
MLEKLSFRSKLPKSWVIENGSRSEKIQDSVQSFQASIVPQVQELTDDIPKYTNSKPLFQIGEIKL